MVIDDTTSSMASVFFAGASKGASGRAGEVSQANGKPQEKQEETEAARNLRLIREKGFRVFIEEMQERKLKELREKILQSMGLSEEDLSAMSAEQRAAIERAVSEKIRERMAAQAAVEGESNDTKGDGEPAGNTGDISAQVLSARAGLGTGLAVLQALEEGADPVPGAKKED